MNALKKIAKSFLGLIAGLLSGIFAILSLHEITSFIGFGQYNSGGLYALLLLMFMAWGIWRPSHFTFVLIPLSIWMGGESDWEGNAWIFVAGLCMIFGCLLLISSLFFELGSLGILGIVLTWMPITVLIQFGSRQSTD